MTLQMLQAIVVSRFILYNLHIQVEHITYRLPILFNNIFLLFFFHLMNYLCTVFCTFFYLIYGVIVISASACKIWTLLNCINYGMNLNTFESNHQVLERYMKHQAYPTLYIIFRLGLDPWYTYVSRMCSAAEKSTGRQILNFFDVLL